MFNSLLWFKSEIFRSGFLHAAVLPKRFQAGGGWKKKSLVQRGRVSDRPADSTLHYNHACFLISSSPDLFAMETDMIPKFSSKDEEIDFWKALSLKYKTRYVTGSSPLCLGSVVTLTLIDSTRLPLFSHLKM